MIAIIIPGIFLILFAMGILFANPKNLPPLFQIIRKGLIVTVSFAIPIYLGILIYNKYKAYYKEQKEQAEAIESERSSVETDSLMRIWIIGSWVKKPNGSDPYNNYYEYTFTKKNTFYTDQGEEGNFKINRGQLFLYKDDGNAEVLDFNIYSSMIEPIDNSVSPDIIKNNEWIFIKSPKTFEKKQSQFTQTDNN